MLSDTTHLLSVTGLHHLICEQQKCSIFFILKALLLSRSKQYKTVLYTYYTSHKNYIKAVAHYVESVVLML